MNGTPLSPERVACRFSSQYLAWREYDARPLRLHYRNYPAPFSMLFQRKREDVPRRIEPENGIPHVRILSAYGNQMTRVERLFWDAFAPRLVRICRFERILSSAKPLIGLDKPRSAKNSDSD